MAYAIKPPLVPMEARSVDEIPVGKNWQYEPKRDGFRCIAFRDGADVCWRPDKSPRQCTLDQVGGREGKSLTLLSRSPEI